MFTESSHKFIKRVPRNWRWIIVALYTLAIYAFLPFATGCWMFLLRHWGQNVNYLGIAFVVGLGLYFLVHLIFQKIDGKMYRYIAFFFISLASVALLRYMCITGAERIHLVMYGVLSSIVFWAMKLDVKSNRVYIYSTLLVFLLGAIDEFIQLFLPSRVFDVRDIFMNWISAGLGMLFLVFVLKSKPIVNAS